MRTIKSIINRIRHEWNMRTKAWSYIEGPIWGKQTYILETKIFPGHIPKDLIIFKREPQNNK